MAKRTTLRLVPTSTLVGGTPPVMWGDARHPAGALRLRPPVPDTEHIRDLEGRARILSCAGEAARSTDTRTARAAFVLLSTTQHLDNLWRLEAHVAQAELTSQLLPRV